jgi:histone-lysine N-methyltransferase SETD3
MIGYRQARGSEIGLKIARSGVELRSEQSYLAAFLLQEKLAAESFFRPYLDTLPNAFPQIPLYYTDDELAQLKGSFTRFLIQHRRASIGQEYQNLCERVAGFDRFTPQQFVWARLVVITRSFGFARDGLETEGLVPLADMLNHHPTRETKWMYEGKKKRFVVSAARNFEVGDPIHGHYGRKCNSRLFVNYGFALPENDDNEAEIVVAIAPNDPLRQAKLSLLDIPGGIRRFQIRANAGEQGVGELRSFLRVACADQEQLARIAHPMASAGGVAAQDASLETRARELLASAAEQARSAFDTTIAQDDILINDPDTPARLRTCAIVRRGEKRVLEHVARFSRDAAGLLVL